MPNQPLRIDRSRAQAAIEVLLDAAIQEATADLAADVEILRSSSSAVGRERVQPGETEIRVCPGDENDEQDVHKEAAHSDNQVDPGDQLKLEEGDSGSDDSLDSLGHEFRGVSVNHISTAILQEMAAMNLPPDSKVYEIEPDVIRKKGEAIICPRDGKLGTAYVDCLRGRDRAALASAMLSYTWGYRVSDISATLLQYCGDYNLDLTDTHIWMCCFCINQHRVKEARAAGLQVPFEEFKKAFGERVAGIGKVVAMMAPWKDPFYIKRVWCDFEMYTATSLKQDVIIAMPPAEAEDFRNTLLAGGIGQVWAALGNVKVEQADASVAEDREQILKLIEEGPGFHRLNVAVAERIQNWIVQSSEGYLQQRIDTVDKNCNGEVEDKELGSAENALDMARLGEQVGDLLRQVGRYDRSEKLLESARQIRQQRVMLETADGANLLRIIGVVHAERGFNDLALEDFEEARRIRHATGSVQTADGARLLSNLGALRAKRGDLDGATRDLEEARVLREATGTLETVEGAQLMMSVGNTCRKKEDFQAARKAYDEAMRIRETTGTLLTPEGARLLSNLALVLQQMGDNEGELQALKKARHAVEVTATLQTEDGAKVLSLLGEAHKRNGEIQQSRELLREAKKIREEMCSPPLEQPRAGAKSDRGGVGGRYRKAEREGVVAEYDQDDVTAAASCEQ